MKNLLFALALLIITTNGAFAASCNGNNDKWNTGNWCVTSADTLIPTSSAGQQVIYETVTAGNNATRQMTPQETGKTITDLGGVTTPGALGGCSKYNLFHATPGLTYTFVAGSRCFITVDTMDAADTILNSISGTGFAAGESLKSAGQAGDFVTVTSTANNKWSITGMRGSWTNNGTN